MYSQLLCNRDDETTQWGKESHFNKWCWNMRTSVHLKMNLNSIITADTKINSKWIPDLNVKPKTIKLSGENMGENVS